MKLKEFKTRHPGGYCLTAAEDIPGFYKKGQSMYGDCDNMIVDSWLYQPLNGIYSIRLKNSSIDETKAIQKELDSRTEVESNAIELISQGKYQETIELLKTI